MGSYGAWYRAYVGMLSGLAKSAEHPSRALSKARCEGNMRNQVL